MASAKAGEAVTTEDGKVICYVKHDIFPHQNISAGHFHDFQEGEMPWVMGQVYDRRCFRSHPATGVMQICINGEWR